MERNFWEMVRARWQKGFFTSVTLPIAVEDWGRMLSIIKETHKTVCAFIIPFPLQLPTIEGVRLLDRAIEIIKNWGPDIPIILDAEFSSGNYFKIFESFGVDATTITPYLGKSALGEFLTERDKGVLVIIRTINKDYAPQDLCLFGGDKFLYEGVAKEVAEEWNGSGNCGAVVETTDPMELCRVRRFIGDMPVLLPRVHGRKDSEGKFARRMIKAGINSQGEGLIFNLNNVSSLSTEKICKQITAIDGIFKSVKEEDKKE